MLVLRPASVQCSFNPHVPGWKILHDPTLAAVALRFGQSQRFPAYRLYPREMPSVAPVVGLTFSPRPQSVKRAQSERCRSAERDGPIRSSQ
jgi:hypothetical protein